MAKKTPIRRQVKKSRKKGGENELTSIQGIVHYFFKLKGWDYEKNKKHLGPVFRRYLRPAKELLKLTNNNSEKAKRYLDIIKRWAEATGLEWSLETVFKRWFDIINERLPQEKIKKPYYLENPMRKGIDQKWRIFVDGEWKIFAGKESEIEWK
ncbi:MAG: hypothetical protein HYV52_00305 [Parcubacteria group bacterium]|nr:hypothetical protein [Parcubacteria group bacterium]